MITIGPDVSIGIDAEQAHACIARIDDAYPEDTVGHYLQLEYLAQLIAERQAALRPAIVRIMDARMAGRGIDHDRHMEKISGACFVRLRGYRYASEAGYRSLRTQQRLMEKTMRTNGSAIRAPAQDTVMVSLSGKMNDSTKEHEL